jgi:hypothetical protein
VFLQLRIEEGYISSFKHLLRRRFLYHALIARPFPLPQLPLLLLAVRLLLVVVLPPRPLVAPALQCGSH